MWIIPVLGWLLFRGPAAVLLPTTTDRTRWHVPNRCQILHDTPICLLYHLIESFAMSSLWTLLLMWLTGCELYRSSEPAEGEGASIYGPSSWIGVRMLWDDDAIRWWCYDMMVLWDDAMSSWLRIIPWALFSFRKPLLVWSLSAMFLQFSQIQSWPGELQSKRWNAVGEFFNWDMSSVILHTRLVRQCQANQRTFPTEFNLIQPRNILFTDAFIDLHSVEEAERRSPIQQVQRPCMLLKARERRSKFIETSNISLLGPFLLDCVFRFVNWSSIKA